jgi:hypothetical protein
MRTAGLAAHKAPRMSVKYDPLPIARTGNLPPFWGGVANRLQR